jgi:DNA-binding transcriptional LysR family regulator
LSAPANNGAAQLDRIDLFRAFVHVVDAASFTRAADRLGLPRSSVSAAIRALEERVGTRLLNRTTRHVAVTPDGAVFHERCLRLLAEVDEAESLFRSTDARPAGKLSVDVPGRIGRLIIVPALADFFARYPEIELSLGVTDRAVNLIEENVDCALRVGPLGDSTLIARRIGDLPLINCASPAYVARFGTPATVADLERHRAVLYASPTTGRVEEWEWVENGIARTCRLRGSVTVNGAEAYVACALAGLGLIQIPAYDVAGHIARGELVELLPDHRPAALPATLLYPHRRHLSRRLNAFMDWVGELLAGHLGTPACAGSYERALDQPVTQRTAGSLKSITSSSSRTLR